MVKCIGKETRGSHSRWNQGDRKPNMEENLGNRYRQGWKEKKTAKLEWRKWWVLAQSQERYIYIGEPGFNCWWVRGPELVLFLF